MNVTKINKLKSGFYQITLQNDEKHDELKIKLTEDELIELNLYTKKTVSLDELALLKEKERYSTFYTSALNYISYKMRSELEISHYLDKKECPKDYKEQIIERLKSLGYIDDKRYAIEYVSYQQTMNLKGPMLLKKELFKKGISKSLTTNTLSTYTEDKQACNITQLIKKSTKSTPKKPLRKVKESILKKIINKGYDFQLANEVMNSFAFDLEINEDSLIEKELSKLAKKYERKHEGYELKVKLTQALMRKGFDYELINQHVSNYLLSKGEE
ncbi:RecX family transcriptional regulator [Haloplasma contractile]|uniref:Regulatory protein RecX n=1 Tax=Haloplasma contractile SSD-17B TaxID=1033810 RepID=U2FDQ8_9MOLU|nr:RecX family transcriptional regulator [Haloplasma contractile]ERJ11115.1 Regulatory protein RecX [Haloplasma contractile SSD-17B]